MAQSRWLAVSLMAFTVSPALAQAPQDFYAGRKMDMVIGYNF